MNEKKLSSRQVAIMMGLSKSTVDRIKNGKTSPTADALEALAKGLKIHITDLIDSPYK